MNSHTNQLSETVLVLLPGLDGTGTLFQPFIDALSGRIHTKTIKYPNDASWVLTDYAAFVKTQLPQKRNVILAESFSGLVALSLLASNNMQIDTVIFCAAFAKSPHPLLLQAGNIVPGLANAIKFIPSFLLKKFCVGADSSETQISSLRSSLKHVDPSVLTQRFRLVAQGAPNIRTKFTVPCYYLQATDDRLVPASALKWFAENFNSFHVEPVNGPHFLLQAEPQECAKRVLTILGSQTT